MTMIETLAKRGNKAAKAVMDAWNPDQERDDKGMWTSGGGATAVTAEQHSGAARAHREAASLGGANAGRHLAAASAHERAAQNARAISVSAVVLRQHSGHMEMSNSANALTRSLENDKGSYKGNPAAEGARA